MTESPAKSKPAVKEYYPPVPAQKATLKNNR